VVQCRPGDVEPLLQVGRGDPLRAGLYDRPKEGETRNVTQCGELFRVTLQFVHIYVSSYIDLSVKTQ